MKISKVLKGLLSRFFACSNVALVATAISRWGNFSPGSFSFWGYLLFFFVTFGIIELMVEFILYRRRNKD